MAYAAAFGGALSSIKRLLSLGGNYMITQLAGLGIYQSQPMIITQMLGPSVRGNFCGGAKDRHSAQ